MTQKDESPNASEGPYWSEELLAVLVVGLGDETQARETLEGIIQQALSGRAGAARHLGRGLGVIASGPAAFPRGRFLAGPGPLDLRVASCCREDGSIFCSR